ncbi:MAG: allantoinase AllB [Candidatus Eisenbacteria bacterium]|uniref:allantoinase n=1 Tax=Eiseniibacteriota bacterium TaxID=2212470 RepID=A0A933W248_UNCEI|nr:allantoinase AllB [Candidatus Eisenbacteria bacterium]
MTGTRVLRSRRVVTPDGVRPACVVVRDGVIAAIEPYAAPLTIDHDLGDVALLPGVVDTHVHVNEPGRTEWEGFATATRAAAAGGVTTIVDMPLNSIPATNDAEALRAKVRAMAGQLIVDVGLWGGVVPRNSGSLAGLAADGALGFKCFLSPSGVDEFGHVGERDLESALPEIARLGLPLLAHAEDPAALLPMPASTRRHADWLASRPPLAEARAIASLARLSAATGAHVHVVHVASRAALDALAAAPAGAHLTAETCPHYLSFCAEEIADGATAFKCAPPIRESHERDALRAALMSGSLAMVASDHSPAPPSTKDLDGGDFARAWGGIASLELALSATWTALAPRGATLVQLARWTSAAPAQLAGLGARKGAIAPGLDADFVAFDDGASFGVNAAALHQRHAVTPYASRTLRGRVRGTWLRGERVYDGAEVTRETHGRWQRRTDAVDPARAFA